jgi:hypothetical protein
VLLPVTKEKYLETRALDFSRIRVDIRSFDFPGLERSRKTWKMLERSRYDCHVKNADFR